MEPALSTIASKRLLDRVFEYDDYRVFLRDFFKAKKQENPHFSQRYFAKKAGFNAHNFCTMVVGGKRNLSLDSIRKITGGIGLKGKRGLFFENLVCLNQALSVTDKDFYFQRIKKIGRTTGFYQLNKNQFFFYEEWYYPVIRELMAFSRWNGDYGALAKMVRPPIAPSKAKQAAGLLLETGMVVKKENGAYSLAHPFVTSEKVPVFIKKKARREVLLKGIEAVENIDPAERYAAYSTVTLGPKRFEEARELLDEVRGKILSLASEEINDGEVYEVALQVFPVSNMNDHAQWRNEERSDAV